MSGRGSVGQSCRVRRGLPGISLTGWGITGLWNVGGGSQQVVFRTVMLSHQGTGKHPFPPRHWEASFPTKALGSKWDEDGEYDVRETGGSIGL